MLRRPVTEDKETQQSSKDLAHKMSVVDLRADEEWSGSF